MDAVSLTTPEDHAKNVHDVSRFQMMLRFFPQCSKSGAKTFRKFVKKNLKGRQEVLVCILQEHAKNVNDMIHGNISAARFNATKLTLMKDDGKYFHAMLGINTKQNVLPTDIGKDFIICIHDSIIDFVLDQTV